MNKKEHILEYYPDETYMFADGFDDAIIGICERTNVIIYSTKRVIEILMEEGMEYEDALEHFSYNVSGSYMGEMTPIFCNDTMFEEYGEG
jgi:hypothetical protein